MPQLHNHSLYEDITHRTDTAPYSIHCTEVAPDCEPALYLHWHDEMEFLLLTHGNLLFHIEDRIYPLEAGDGIFIPPGLLHYAEHNGPDPVIFHAFVLSPEFVFPSVDTHRLQQTRFLKPINILNFSTPLREYRFSWL